MTKLQKVTCIILSVFFFAVLLLVPGPFFLRGNVYRQLPLYCFLEEEATSVPQREDPETYEKLVESNAKYLADMMKAENLQSGSDDMRENQETAAEKEKNRPEKRKALRQRRFPHQNRKSARYQIPLPVRQSVQQPLHSLPWRRYSLLRLLIWHLKCWQTIIICWIIFLLWTKTLPPAQSS